MLPGTIPANSKKVTIIAPQLITPEEAYRLFLAALDSVGLTVEPSGKFLRIIETLRAKSTSIPVYGLDSEAPAGESYVTRLVRVENGDVNEIATVLGRLKGEQGDIIPVRAPERAHHHRPRREHRPHAAHHGRDRPAAARARRSGS